jgi:hypothetical protein
MAKDPMLLKTVNRVCYTICIASIFAAVTCGLFLVWGSLSSHDGWKYMATSLIVFFGAGATLSVNQVILRGRRSDDA